MKYTLLEIVQDIASGMDSDEVNSISDSVESMQIAFVVRTAYENLISRMDVPEHYAPFNLTSSGDVTKPTIMYVPEDMTSVRWVKYSYRTLETDELLMQDVIQISLKDFMDMMYQIPETETNVTSFDVAWGTSVIPFRVYNDRHPCYYAAIDDRTMVFDAYDSTIDTTLQDSKTVAYGRKIVPFDLADTFVPNLDETQFPLLMNEARSLAWVELKQTQHPKAEQNSRRGWVRFQNTQNRAGDLSDLYDLPDFGRSAHGYSHSYFGRR